MDFEYWLNKGHSMLAMRALMSIHNITGLHAASQRQQDKHYFPEGQNANLPNLLKTRYRKRGVLRFLFLVFDISRSFIVHQWATTLTDRNPTRHIELDRQGPRAENLNPCLSL